MEKNNTVDRNMNKIVLDLVSNIRSVACKITKFIMEMRTKNKPMVIEGGDSELNEKARSWSWDRILDICSKRGKGQKGDPVVKLVFPDGYLEYYDVERGEILANKTIRDSGSCVFFLVENRVVASNCNWGQEWYEYDEDHKFFESERDIDSFIDEFEKNLKKTRTVEEVELSFFED